MDFVQVLLTTRMTAGSKLDFWRGVLSCAKPHSECIEMCFPADPQIPREQAGTGWSEVASPSAGLGPACSSSCSLCACYSPFCKALAIPAWALPRWFSELLLQGVLEGDWILVLPVIPSCTAELCFLCLRGESCCRWSCGYPGPQTTLYSGNQRPRISIILGVAVH